MNKRIPATERILARSHRDDSSCWMWTGRLDRDGYGVIKSGGSPRFAHRYSYEAFIGPIPEGMQIDHLCRNRACVNPGHMEPVDSRTNTMRSPVAPAAVNARKVACDHGHLLDGKNLYTHPTTGYRACRTCRRENTARWRASRSA